MEINNMFLSREQIEAALKGVHTSYKLSIREALETALTLDDKLNLANEEIKHAYNDNETHRRRISELELENERLKVEAQITSAFLEEAARNADKIAAWGKILDRNEELEAEIERLKREQLEWSREALEHAKELAAENARLKEELEVYMERKTDGKKQFAMMEQIRAENARLREEVERMARALNDTIEGNNKYRGEK